MQTEPNSEVASVTDTRTGLFDFVCGDLVGPAHGPEEVLEDAPYVKYAAGVLFPREAQSDESGSFGGVEAHTNKANEPDIEDDIVVSDADTSEQFNGSDTDVPEIYDDLITLRTNTNHLQ